LATRFGAFNLDRRKRPRVRGNYSKKKKTGIYTEFVPGDGRLTLIKVERSSGSSPRGGNDKEFSVNRKFSGFIIKKTQKVLDLMHFNEIYRVNYYLFILIVTSP
jgi:hypothetical protein